MILGKFAIYNAHLLITRPTFRNLYNKTIFEKKVLYYIFFLKCDYSEVNWGHMICMGVLVLKWYYVRRLLQTVHGGVWMPGLG